MIIVNKNKLSIEHFPDGTLRLNVDKVYPNYNTIVWKYESEEELPALIYVTKYLKEHTDGQIHLKMYYLVNARMDRTKSCEEVFTLKYFADVINWLHFDSVGDFSPLSQLTVTEVKEIGRLLDLPIDLVDKVPSDGLCGKTDEDNLGFTYAELDRYIRTGEIENGEVKSRIDNLHDKNLFKLQLMPSFEYRP